MRKIIALFVSALVYASILGSTSAFAASDYEWIQKSSLPSERSGAAVATVNGKIYVFGGTSNGSEAVEGEKTNTTFEYDPQTNIWTEKQPMPTTRSAVTAAVYNEKIYVIGGYFDQNGKTVRSNAVEAYDTQTDTWEKIANLPTARSWASAVTVDNKIFVVGGANNSGTITATVECYDLLNKTWSKKNNFPKATNALSLIVANDEIFAFGGIAEWSKPSSVMTGIYQYNKSTDQWVLKNDLIDPKNAAASVTVNGDIYILGGYNSSGAVSKTVEVYDPSTNQSIINENLTLTSARSMSVAATINREIYIIGGVNGEKNGTIGLVESYSKIPSPQPEPSGNRAILVITLDTGLEKEFDLSMEEVNAFITWYENKQAGTGTASYAIDKHNNNKGPFSARKDYVIFDKILTFEVNEYNSVTNE
ncbi:kelch repeat-containing protein [Paenibacillus macerans]|uniref:Kelch repeat-containing protein n=1 Tax=Paenibacillus macerans TaxID=44252 RepID=UPI002E1CFD52|nr:kelch repeat-containing protein [Paenibacillus macerans]